jgi:peptide/nickel transport system ATP-binding protein
MTDASPVLQVEHLSIGYLTRRGAVQAVRDLSFELGRSETLAIIGESGSGKTTLAQSLVRLSPRSARVFGGRILYRAPDGQQVDVGSLDANALRRYRWQSCALVFQSALNAFNPVLTIREHFVDTARAHGAGDVRQRATELLAMVNLDPARVLPAFPHELSGGMRQRVLIALGLLLAPQILILDEPTTALDILTQRQVIDLLRSLKERLGFALVFISHDLALAAELADRVLVMYAGRIVETATVSDLFYRPRHPYSLGLLRAVPRVSGALGNLESIVGSPPDLIRLPPGCSYAPRCPFAVDACRQAEPPLLDVDTPAHRAACIRWSEVAATVPSFAPAAVGV